MELFLDENERNNTFQLKKLHNCLLEFTKEYKNDVNKEIFKNVLSLISLTNLELLEKNKLMEKEYKKHIENMIKIAKEFRQSQEEINNNKKNKTHTFVPVSVMTAFKPFKLNINNLFD